MNWDDIKIFLEVARTEKLNVASKRLGVDPSTASRRIYKLEEGLKTQLFTRTMEGHVLTEHGKTLFETALQMEKQSQQAQEILHGKNLDERGSVRIGTTEAFGSFFIAPRLAKFTKENPNILIELLPLPRFVKLAKHEADMSISIEKPQNTSLIISKLCDYRLMAYATKKYIAQNKPIKNLVDLKNHPLIGYINNLAFSEQLQYLEEILPDVPPGFSSTSVVAQYMATNEHAGLAILPCFLAQHNPDLVPVIRNKINIIRSFWLAIHPERKKLARMKKVWDFLKEMVEENSRIILGD